MVCRPAVADPAAVGGATLGLAKECLGGEGIDEGAHAGADEGAVEGAHGCAELNDAKHYGGGVRSSYALKHTLHEGEAPTR